MSNKKRPNWLVYSNLGLQLVFFLLICFYIGYSLEKHALIDSPIGIILGLFIGFSIGMYEIWKIIFSK